MGNLALMPGLWYVNECNLLWIMFPDIEECKWKRKEEKVVNWAKESVVQHTWLYRVGDPMIAP